MARSISTDKVKQNARKSLGEGLRASRLSRGLSVLEVARETGISRPILYNIEDGTQNPTIDTIAVLCGLYGLELELVERKENG